MRFTGPGCLVAALIFATAAHAEPPRPTVDFEADWYLRGQGHESQATMRYDVESGKMRLDMTRQGMAMSTIHDKDANETVMWSDQMPGMAMRMTMPKPETAEMEKTTETRTINGIECTVWQMPKATACLTEENIPLETGGEGYATAIENLKITPQDPALFEVPAGRQVMDIPAGAPGMEGTAPAGGAGMPF